jgi:hypothetical protein
MSGPDAMDKTGGRMTSDGMDDAEIREHGRDDADLSSRERSINNQRITNEQPTNNQRLPALRLNVIRKQ